MLEAFIALSLILGTLALIYLLTVWFKKLDRQRNLLRKSGDWQQPTGQVDLSNLSQLKRDVAPKQVSPTAQSRLYALVSGDKALANRLVEQARSLNPTKSEQWLWEKVIVDLERDRRA